MCDSCIIQLNVAYNLKKNAIQSDMKLRQYMIEYGMSVTSYTTCSINTVSVIRPPQMILPANTSSTSMTITTAKSTTVNPIPAVVQSTVERRPFPVMPVIIKEEPVDYEVMSDITVDTITEPYDDRNCRNDRPVASQLANNTPIQQKSSTPLPPAMVAVNSKSLLLTGRNSSDNEYISAYIPSSASSSDQQSTTVSSTSLSQSNLLIAARKDETNVSHRIAKSKDKIPQKPSAQPTVNVTKRATEKQETPSIEINKTISDKDKSKKIEENKKIDQKRTTRRNTKENTSLNEVQREPRTRNAKKDYKSFFKSSPSTTTTTIASKKIQKMLRPRRMSFGSAKISTKQGNQSPILTQIARKIQIKHAAKSPVKNAMKRGRPPNSMTYHRSSI